MGIELECLKNILPPLPHYFFKTYFWCRYVLTLDSHVRIILFSFFNRILTSAIWTSSSYTISIYCPETLIKIQLHFCCNVLNILFLFLAYYRFASSPEWMCWFVAITSVVQDKYWHYFSWTNYSFNLSMYLIIVPLSYKCVLEHV